MRTGLLVVLMMSAAHGAAHAEAPGDVLVLPTQLAGAVPDRAGWQREFDARLERAVQKAGRASRPPGPLTAAEASCRAAECMGRLAESAGVQVVIGAHVAADHGSPPSYKITIDRYDRDRPDRVRQEEADCTVCTEVETADRLEQVATTLLPAPTTVQVVPPPSSEVVPAPAPRSYKKLYAAIAVTSVLAVGGIAMIGVGGKALSINNDVVANDPSRLYDTKGTGAGLIAAGAVLTIGAAIGLGVECVMLKRARR